MATPSRRTFLKMIAAGALARPCVAFASKGTHSDPHAAAVLYDATGCVGCKACVTSCKRANDMPPEAGAFDPDGLWDAPSDLDAKTRTVIKLYKATDGLTSFVKRQCMHCSKPACVSACPVSAMQKDEQGIVFYDKGRCIGCRYCMVACPYNVPKFQWGSATPQIVKCDLCKFTNLPKKGQPACAEVCPTGALAYGRRADLLAEARRRLRDSPESYVNRVYGEHEGGGTNVLYLAGVPFEELGLPQLTDESGAALTETIQHAIYKGFIAPLALYAGLFFIALGNRNKGTPREERQARRGD